MRDHFAKALALATREGRLAARAEILALRALLSARLGDEQGDPSLLALAEESAAEVTRRAAELPGRPPWAAQADAARASVAVSRGDLTTAVEFGRAALAARELAMREDPHLEILLPAARAVLAAGDPAEQEALRYELRLVAGMIARRTLDADVRRRWLGAWPGLELVALSGWSEGAATAAAAGDVPAEASTPANEDRLLRALTEGLPDHEIAREMGLSEDEVAGALTALYARIGAGSRTEATVYAVTRSVA
jgi:DNA-binding NarL/FixJ family response regulator